MTQPATKLTPLKVDLLRLFSRPMSDQQLLEIKQLLVDYYARPVRWMRRLMDFGKAVRLTSGCWMSARVVVFSFQT